METTFITPAIQKKKVLDKYEEKRYYSSKHLNLIAFFKILQLQIAAENTGDSARERKVMFLNKQLRAAPSPSLHFSDIFISLPFFPFVWKSFSKMFSSELHEQQPQDVQLILPCAASVTWGTDHLCSEVCCWVDSVHEGCGQCRLPRLSPEQPANKTRLQGWLFLRKCPIIIKP